MTAWSDRAEQLLFDGETIDTEVAAGGATVVVTSHRLLAFTPQADGKDYRAVDRPNVRDVERQAVYGVDFRRRIAKLGVVGLLLAGLGLAFDPSAWLPQPDVDAPAEAGGVGGVLGMVEGMIGFFHALDTVLLAAGGLALTVALGLAGVQLATRSVRVAIHVAGEDPVHLPERVDDETLEQLRAAAEPPEPAGESGEPAPDPSGPSSDSEPVAPARAAARADAEE